MRHLAPLAALLVAACASTPPPTPVPVTPTVVQEPPKRGDLIGLSANELVARFGTPRLQVREGAGTKLQFLGSTCVLDAYLYAPATGGAQRVAHVDTRNREGRAVNQASCIAALGAR